MKFLIKLALIILVVFLENLLSYKLIRIIDKKEREKLDKKELEHVDLLIEKFKKIGVNNE